MLHYGRPGNQEEVSQLDFVKQAFSDAHEKERKVRKVTFLPSQGEMKTEEYVKALFGEGDDFPELRPAFARKDVPKPVTKPLEKKTPREYLHAGENTGEIPAGEKMFGL